MEKLKDAQCMVNKFTFTVIASYRIIPWLDSYHRYIIHSAAYFTKYLHLISFPQTHHVYERYIKEHSRGESEHPDYRRFITANKYSNNHTQECDNSRDHVVRDGLLYGHTGFNQHRKIA